jgi:hypothetical protein
MQSLGGALRGGGEGEQQREEHAARPPVGGDLLAQPLAPEPPAYPPERIVGLVEVGQRPAGPGQMVELPGLHRRPDLVLGDRRDRPVGDPPRAHRAESNPARARS